MSEQADPSGILFQNGIIRQLVESMRQQTEALGDMQKQLAAMVERLTRIHDDVERIRQVQEAEMRRVDALMRDKDRRDGALGAWVWLQRSAPWAAMITAAVAVVAWLKE